MKVIIRKRTIAEIYAEIEYLKKLDKLITDKVRATYSIKKK